MAVSIWDKPAKLTLAPFPFEKYALAGASKQKAYDEGEKAIGDLETEFGKIKAIKDIDTPKRDERLNQYRNMISGLYDQSKGDPNAMLSGLRQIRSKFIQDVNYGDLGQMHQKAVALEQAQEDYKKASTEGKFSGLDDLVYDYAVMSPLKEYATKGGHGRDEKGFTTNLNLGSMPKIPEVLKTLSDTFQQWKADKYPSGLTPYKDPNTGQLTGYLVNGTTKFVDKNEVVNAVMGTALTAPEFRMVNQMLERTANPEEQITIQGKKGPIALTGANARKYNFYSGIADAIGEREGFKETDLNYMWDQMAEEGRKKKEEEQQPYGTIEEGPASSIENVTGISSDFFDVTPKGTKVEKISTEGAQALRLPSGRVVLSSKTTTADEYKDPTTLEPKQKQMFDSMIKSLDDSPEFAPIVAKYNKGIKLSTEELAKVYPQMKLMNDQINKLQVRNPTIVSLTPAEQKQANTMFGTSGDAAVTVEQLGTGIAGNRKVFDVESGKEITYSELIKKLKESPLTSKGLITISGKLTGTNPYSAITNNRRYANGYQFFIGGKPYAMEGPKAFVSPQQQAQAAENEFVSSVYKARIMPGASLSTTFPTGDIKVDVKYTQDPNNPDAGFFNIDNVQVEGTLSDQELNLLDVIRRQPYTDAAEINTVLNQFATLVHSK